MRVPALMRVSAPMLALLVLLVAACAPAPTPAATTSAALRITLEPGGAALIWGDGPYGVVLLHGAAYDAASWEPQARVLADDQMRVLAVEEVTADALRTAIAHLHGEGIERVAVVAASAGAAAAFEVGVAEPELVDQLIVVSGTGNVSGLGEFPKLFAASEGEPAAADAERMEGEAPGAWNAVLLVPGDAHGQAIFDSEGGDELLAGILRRLGERR